MRLLFFAVGSRGDVQPMLALALRAKACGHQAAVLAAPNFRPFVERYGVEFRSLRIDLEQFMRDNADLGTQGLWRTLKRSHDAVDEHLTDHFTALEREAKSADAIIAGGLAFAAPSVAEAHGIPFRFVIYCPTALASRQHAPIFLPWQDLPAFVNRALWFVLGVFYNRLVGKPVNAWRRAHALPPMRDLLDYMCGERVLIAADAALAPVPRDVRVEVVRGSDSPLPLVETLDARIEAFLATGPKPIFIGFGSMPDDDPQRTTAILVGAVRAAGLRAIVARGWAGLGGEVSQGDDILWIDEAPHAILFERVAAVVHHGGAGTTHAAMRAGVPQVIVIHMMDQNYWAKRVEALALGPKALKRTRLDASSLARALHDAVSDPRHARAASAWAQKLAPPAPFSELLGALRLC